MRAHVIAGALATLLLGGCGLENMFGNVGRSPHPIPASAIAGAAAWPGANCGSRRTTSSSSCRAPSASKTSLLASAST